MQQLALRRALALGVAGTVAFALAGWVAFAHWRLLLDPSFVIVAIWSLLITRLCFDRWRMADT